MRWGGKSAKLAFEHLVLTAARWARCARLAGIAARTSGTVRTARRWSLSARVVYFASGSGRSWNCTTLLGVPLPVSVWNGARVP